MKAAPRKAAARKSARKPEPVTITPNPVGRPTDYRPEYCEQVVALGRLGKSVVQMACALECHKATLYEWDKAHPEFRDAFTHARALSQDWWENAGQTGMMLPGMNAGIWSRSMAARFPDDYTEKTKTELTGANGGGLEVRVAAMTPEERRAEIQQLLAQHPALTQKPA